MLKTLLLFLFFLLTHSHKIGLLLSSEEPDYSAAVRNVAEFTISQLADSSTELTLITREYGSAYLSLPQTLCSLLESNVSAVLSAGSSSSTAIEADVTSQFQVPYLSAVATNPFLMSGYRDYLLLLSPSDKHQSEAIFDLLSFFQWYEFSILASADDYGINGVIHLQYLATRDSNFDVKDVQHFDVSKILEDEDYIKTELELIKKSITKVIVLNCDAYYAKTIFSKANDMGMMKEGFVWIVTDGITGMPNSIICNGSCPSYYKGIIGTVPSFGKESTNYDTFKDSYFDYGGSLDDLSMGSVIVSDAIGVVHAALAGLSGSIWDSVPAVDCTSGATWSGGETLFNAISAINFTTGISGEITFANGTVGSTFYDIMNFKSNEFVNIGNWSTGNLKLRDPDKDIVYLGGGTTQPSGYSDTLTGFHLTVSIVQEPPIAYLRDSCNDTTLPSCWYGWNPDIISKLAKDLNFTYEYLEPADKKYGGYDGEEWNGMIRDIVNRTTDMTTALAINVERSAHIDFTLSFFEDQASFIVYSTSSESSTNEYFFLLPFEASVWASIGIIIVLLSFLVTFLSKLSPYGRYGRKIHALQTCTCEKCKKLRELKMKRTCQVVDPCDGKTEVDGKTILCAVDRIESGDSLDYVSIYNSAWVVSSGLVQQGSETIHHDAPSSRLLLFTWWLFVMILVSMYTANLTAHLTLERSSISIGSMVDLLDQSEYTWGVITDRNLESMMLNHGDDDYKNLISQGSSLKTLQEGMDKVRATGFVLIDESSVLSFNFKDDCTAVQTNTGKFSNEWAFGLPTHSPYKTLINHMFLQYREQGWFTEKWDEWYSSDGLGCSDSLGSDDRFDLNILSGLFFIFFIGVGCSFVMVMLETLYVAHTDEGGYWECLTRRLVLKRDEILYEWMGQEKFKEKDYVIEMNSASLKLDVSTMNCLGSSET